MDKPDVDSIEASRLHRHRAEGGSHNPRSTVGTSPNLRLPAPAVRARRHAALSRHGIDLAAQTVSQMVDQVLRLPEGLAAALARPDGERAQGQQLELLEDLAAQGFVRVRIDGDP